MKQKDDDDSLPAPKQPRPTALTSREGMQSEFSEWT